MKSIAWAAAIALTVPVLQTPPPVFHATVEAVRLDVSVTRGGRPVTGLTRDDFVVTDNDVPQSIASVTPEDGPLSIILALDTSGSMAGDALLNLEQAGNALVSALHPVDRLALVSFSQQILVQLPLTADRAPVRAALASLSASGSTALRDALFTALQLRPSDDSRPLVLLVSDGADDASWLTAQETLDAVRRAGVTVDAVEIGGMRFPDSRGRVSRPRNVFLDEATQASGGTTWRTPSASALQDLFTRALDDMRTRYLLSYYPEGVARGGWHALHVRLKRGAGEIRTRSGYLVPPSQP